MLKILTTQVQENIKNQHKPSLTMNCWLKWERFDQSQEIRHSENKNVMQLTLSESEVKAAVQ